MDLDEITKILELMREHELAEFELERDAMKLRMRKHGPSWTAAPAQAAVVPAPTAASVLAPAPSAAAPTVPDDLDLAIVKSPIVGTFYASPEPGAKVFAAVGQAVRKGQVLCIIEAMKLMNEINAECDGEVVKVYVDSGHAVQYGARLFAIKPA